MTFKNGLSDSHADNQQPGGNKVGRRGNVRVLAVDQFNVVEIRREEDSELRGVGRLLCYMSASLSFGLAVAFALTFI